MSRSMTKSTKIPAPTIERLALYSRPLEALLGGATPVISSEKLASLCGVNPAQVRKDLAYFGEFGVRGVGYDIGDLLRAIKKILATDRQWKLCIVGMGHLGCALIQNENFLKRGYLFVAAFDSDPAKKGETLPSGLVIHSMQNLKEVVHSFEIDIGVITTPPQSARRVADMLMDAGVSAILNFAPIQIRSPKCCVIENVDFTVRLENLAYHLTKLR
jgi:redox-sensing transcriptional repressor